MLSEYVGEYALNSETSVTITLEDGDLYAQPTGQQRVPIFAEAPDHFFVRAVNAQLRFSLSQLGGSYGSSDGS